MFTASQSLTLAKTSVVVYVLAAILACSGGGGQTRDTQPVPNDGPPTEPPATSCAFGGTVVSITTSSSWLEAENHDTCDTSFVDVSEGNSGGAYREQDVDILADNTRSNGHYVGDMEAGEYLEYSIDVARSGIYNMTWHLKSGGLIIEVDGEVLDDSGVNTTDDKSWSNFTRKVYLSDGPQVLRLKVLASGAALDTIEFTYTENLDVNPWAAVAAMGIGINLGNTLDAPNEGDWAIAAQKHYFSDFREAGFDHVRVPVTWGNHTAETAPYTVDAERMDRTEQVVDWALAQGYYVILNAHHETWLKEDYNNSASRDRFDAIWTQIAERFKDKSSRLIFEILNEPQGMTMAQTNELNKRVLDIIRASNPTRLVIFSGNGFTPIGSLLAADIPDDNYLIGNFHSYDPWEFAGQCMRTWGSQEDVDALVAIYQSAQDWSLAHNIPVMVNEFGAAHYDYQNPQNICDQGSRLLYLQTHVNTAIQMGLAATVWDDGGSFVIYHRDDGTWEEGKAILVAPNP